MTESESPSLVFRKTSLTARQRFTPAGACSTLTRTRASLWFVRFSARVSSPRGGFFFPLASFFARWLVPLKPGGPLHHPLPRAGYGFLTGPHLVMARAGAGSPQQ